MERIATFADRLKEAMRLREKRQTDLCKECHIPKGAMSLYLSGAYEPRQDRLELLAVALNVDVSWLMGYDTDREKNLPPSKDDITGGEKEWLELYNRFSCENRGLLVEAITDFIELSEESQKIVLNSIRGSANRE